MSKYQGPKTSDDHLATQNDLEVATGEGWHQVGGGGEPAWQNSWGGTVYFRIDDMKIVHLRGLCSGGTLAAAAFTLPSGYRPASDEIFSTASVFFTGWDASRNRIDVYANGNVTPNENSVMFSGATFSDISFRAA